MITIIYFIGWVITVNLGYLWLIKNEREHPEYDYHLAGIMIITISLFWPIAVPILLIKYLIDKFK